MRAKALRHSLWLALVHAQELGWTAIQGQLISILVDVDARREALDEVEEDTEVPPRPARRRMLHHHVIAQLDEAR